MRLGSSTHGVALQGMCVCVFVCGMTAWRQPDSIIPALWFQVVARALKCANT